MFHMPSAWFFGYYYYFYCAAGTARKGSYGSNLRMNAMRFRALNWMFMNECCDGRDDGRQIWLP